MDRGLRDVGTRALVTYDEFLGILDDPQSRRELKELAIEDADRSDVFVHIKGLGKEFQASLLSLLFDDEEMMKLVREYLIF